MKIYEYTESEYGRKIEVKEIEVEEKAKSYKITSHNYWRSSVKKSDIGELMGLFCSTMYLTERDDKRYINALIEYQERKVSAAQAALTAAEIKLENYKKHLEQEAAE